MGIIFLAMRRVKKRRLNRRLASIDWWDSPIPQSQGIPYLRGPWWYTLPDLRSRHAGGSFREYLPTFITGGNLPRLPLSGIQLPQFQILALQCQFRDVAFTFFIWRLFTTCLTFGTLAAVVTLRGLDQVLRYSIDRPTVELLYLPLPPEHTFQVKAFIDTVIWRLGDGLAAFTIIVFGFALAWTPRQVTWVNLTLLAGWLVAAWVAQRLYVANLEESIHTHRLNTEQASAPMLDRAATDLLASRLQSTDVEQILYALSQFGAAQGGAAHPAVRELLAHPHPDVRRMAVELLDHAGDLTVIPAVERLLYDTELPVRTSALLFVAHHAHIDPLERIEQLGDFEDFSIRSAMVSFLAQPGPTENLEAAGVIFNTMVEDPDVRTREEAARLLLQLPDSFGVGAVEQLLQSPDDRVVRLALASVTRLPRRHFIPLVLK